MKITFKTNPQDLRDKYSIFASASFAIIANEIQVPQDRLLINKKLDLDRFYNYLKSKYGKVFNRSLGEMKDLILEAAPLLGITGFLKLSREEKSNLDFQEKYVYGHDFPMEYFTEAEIPMADAAASDHILRSMYGETEPACYRFDKMLNEHEVNMMKVAYVYKYGDPEKTMWKNYLDARPATLGHIENNGKSVNCTREIGEFTEKVYS